MIQRGTTALNCASYHDIDSDRLVDGHLLTNCQCRYKGGDNLRGADMEMMPANWEIQDQACVRVDLCSAGKTLSFDISTDSEVDILLFSSNATCLSE